MLFRYNIEKIKKIMLDFYNVSKISVCILDAELNRLVAYPKPWVHFCAAINSTPEGRRRCNESDCTLFARSIESRRAESHICHAGLFDTVVPIFNNEMLLGFVIFGQVGLESENRLSFDDVYARVADLHIDKDDFEEAYREMQFLTQEEIDSAVAIVVALTKYLMLEEMIKPDYDNNVDKIVEYIDCHLTEELSISNICREFNISKNTLYNIFNQHFECGIREYITSRRITRSEQLLKTTDLPIYQICEKCGIRNCQYFCRLFKKEKNITQLQYMKMWKSLVQLNQS